MMCCVFGYVVLDVNVIDFVFCKCLFGYWGEDCFNFCLGGLRKICNGYGVCSEVNGICDCDVYWRGNVINLLGDNV